MQKHPPSKAPGDAAAGGGVVSTAITQATDQLTPLGGIDFVAKAIAVITVTGVLVTIAGFGYRFWAKRREAALADALDTAS